MEILNVDRTFWYDNFLKHMVMLLIHEEENLLWVDDWLQFVQTEHSNLSYSLSLCKISFGDKVRWEYRCY